MSDEYVFDDDFDINATFTPIGEDDVEEAQQADVMRSFLDEYDLDDEDQALLDGEIEFAPVTQQWGKPVLTILGRPNVGKSTLVNRIVGQRVAVVQDTPGVTRDRVKYDAEWAGVDFTIMDTGGWEAAVEGIDKSVSESSEMAINEADVVMLVVDATVGATDTDERMVRLLRRSGKPVILAANKVDSPQGESDAAALWNLGLGEPYPISALHGRGLATYSMLLSRCFLKFLKWRLLVRIKVRRITLVGRPNVGKSSLLNKLAGSERVVVNELAGTTRDPVDEVIELDGQPWTFVDTAGVRRRVHLTKGADYYATLRTQSAIEKAELGLVLMDASEPIAEQDIRVFNK